MTLMSVHARSAKGAGRGPRRIVSIWLCLSVVMSGLVVVVAGEIRPAAAYLDPDKAPLICDGSGALAFDWGGSSGGSRTAPRFVNVWVPAGSTVNFSVSGRVNPTHWVGTWHAQETLEIGLQEIGSTELNGSQQKLFAESSDYQADYPGWSEFGPWTPAIAISGAARPVRLWLRGTGGLADAGEWTAHITITGGDGFDGSECDKLRNFLGVPETSGSAADPVNTATGNFYDQTEDFSTPANVYGLEFERTYNSMDRTTAVDPNSGKTGVLGSGWTTTLDTSLTNGHGGALVLREPDGRRIVFPAGSTSGQWTVPASLFASVVVTPNANPSDERRVLTYATGELWTFDGNGRLLEMADGRGQKVTVGWNAKAPSSLTASNLAGTGLALTFVDANNDGLIEQLVRPDGSKTNFTFTTAGRLETVSEAHYSGTPAVAERYEYEPDGRMERIRTTVDPTGTPVVRIANTYDIHGRVETQAYPTGETATFAYCLPTEAGCGITDSTLHVTRVTHSAPGVSDESVYHLHDATGRLARVVDPLGEDATLTWSTNDQPDTMTSRRGNPSQSTFTAAGLFQSFAQPTSGGTQVSSQTTSVAYCGTNDPRVKWTIDQAGIKTMFIYGTGTESAPCAGTSFVPSKYVTAQGITGLAATTLLQSSNGLVTQVTDPDNVVTDYVWDAPTRQLRRITRHSDTADLVTHFGYDTAGRPWVVRTPEGNETWFSYNAAGKLAQERGPIAQTRTCSPSCNFSGGPPTSGPVRSTSYWTDGTIRQTTDELSLNTTHTRSYLSGGGWTDTTLYPSDGDGTAADLRIDEYDAAGRQIKMTVGDSTNTADRSVTTYTYGPLGRLSKESSQEGVETRYRYDVDGNLTETILGPSDGGDDPDDNDSDTTTRIYDGRGRLTEVQGPDIDTSATNRQLHSLQIFAYDTADRLTFTREGQTTGDTLRTHRSYDAAGRLQYEVLDLDNDNVSPSTAIDPDDRVTQYVYTAGGRLHQVRRTPHNVGTFTWNATTTSDKLVTTYEYDAAGRTDAITDPSGTTTLAYDGDDRVISETAPGGHQTTTTYNPAGQPLLVTTPSPVGTGTVTAASTYTARGELATVTDSYPSGTSSPPNPTRYGYFPDGRKQWVDDPRGDGSTTSPTRIDYGYDGRGNRVARSYTTMTGLGSSPTERTETWGYNHDNQVTSHTRPDTSARTLGYDNRGRQTADTSPAGRSTATTYWNSGLPHQVTSTQTGQTTVVVTRSYDSRGRRTTMTDPTGTSSLVYDRASNIISFEQPNPSATSDPLTFTATADLNGNRKTLTYEDGAQFRYAQNDEGLLDQADVWIAGANIWFPVAEYTYDDDGDPLETIVAGTYGNRSWTYRGNDAHEPETFTQDMDPDGTESETDNGGGGTQGDITTTLTWRPDGRMSTEATNAETRTYSYDAAGQLTGRDSNTTADYGYAYGPTGERLLSTVGSASTEYTYNAASHLTATDTTGTANDVAYTYDADGLRTGTNRGSGTSVATLSYDARGILAQTARTGGPTITRTYDGDRRLTQTYDGTARSHLAWDPTTEIPQLLQADVDGDLWTRMAYGNERIGFQFFAGGTQLAYGHYPYNAHGDAIPNGANISTPGDYDPYGTPTDLSATNGQTTYVGYRGELHLDGLVHLRNRDYDPTTGTFTTPDPLDGVDGAPTVANPYDYVENDPLNKTDPMGLRPDDPEVSSLGLCAPALALGLIDGPQPGPADIPAGLICGAVIGTAIAASLVDDLPDVDLPDVGDDSDPDPRRGPGNYPPPITDGRCHAPQTQGDCDPDHIVLGLRDYGLREAAARVGGRHLLGDPNWRFTFLEALGDPAVRFTISLDGLDGVNPTEQLRTAVLRGAGGSPSPTNWEIAQLHQVGRLSTTSLVEDRGRRSVPNPWPSLGFPP